ncbi:substrate-binding domain-containing protein [Streptacidiphilus monticola]
MVVGLEPFDEDTVRALRAAGAAVVFTTEAEIHPTMRRMGRLQAQYLIARGHRRIGYAMPALDHLRRIAEQRALGVEDACTAAGLAPPLVLDTGIDVAVMARAARRWRREQVTAVCAYNDEQALALLSGMRQARLSAPEDLAVIGVDDIPLARAAEPPLTTVTFDLEGAGHAMAQAVVDALRDAQPQPSPTPWPAPSCPAPRPEPGSG